jgi:hypothetical protein
MSTQKKVLGVDRHFSGTRASMYDGVLNSVAMDISTKNSHNHKTMSKSTNI